MFCWGIRYCDEHFSFQLDSHNHPSFLINFSIWSPYSCPSASLDYIIEPWFLGGGAEGPGGPEFNEWADDAKAKYGTVFGTSIADLPEAKQPRCFFISGRTADNPRLFGECVEAGCKTIVLEKPGAPTVTELQKMKDDAETAGVAVLMGYNKVWDEEQYLCVWSIEW